MFDCYEVRMFLFVHGLSFFQWKMLLFLLYRHSDTQNVSFQVTLLVRQKWLS